MTERHHVLDSDPGETAEEFLQRISRPAPVPASRPQPAPAPTAVRQPGPGRRRTPVVGGRGVRPWVAASASLLLWGGGQWANGQRALGILFLTLQALVLALSYSVMNAWGRVAGLGRIFEFREEQIAALFFGIAGLVPILWVAGMLQAYATATRGPKPWRFDGPMLLPPATSLLVPGWGQILNGQVAKGGTFLMLWATAVYGLLASLRFPELWSAYDRTVQPLAGTSLTLAQLVMLGTVGLVWVVGVYDALLTARHRDG